MALIAAKDKGEKKLFGFAFSPLMRDDGTTLSDDTHELYVYKVRPAGPPPCGSHSPGQLPCSQVSGFPRGSVLVGDGRSAKGGL